MALAANSVQSSQAPEIHRAMVLQQVEKIASSDPFARSERMKRFLRFTVRETLQGRQGSLKEYSIALAVFDKPESFDPRLDPIVRVEAGRLRSKLREYYTTTGQSDPVAITYQKRGYVPEIGNRMASANAPGAYPSLRQPDPLEVARDDAANLSSIAVLPLADLSEAGDQEVFCDGLMEELISALSGVPNLRVAARTSSMLFKNEAVDIREVGRRLDVQTVLEGSVRRDGDRMRVSVQWINAIDGYHIWSASYNAERRDVLSVQERISTAVVDSLKPHLVAGSSNV